MINKNIKLEQIVDQLLFSIANFVSLISLNLSCDFSHNSYLKSIFPKKKNQYRPMTFEEGKNKINVTI